MNGKITGKIRKTGNCLAVLILAGALVIPASASSISEIQQQINQQQQQINEINSNIEDWEDAQDLLEEEISDLDAELLNTMTAIGLLEDDIAEKTADIEYAQAMYEDAKETEEAQYEAMKVHIQFMYESGNASYLEVLFASADFADFINQLEYMEELYTYDQKLLEAYVAQKELVAALWAQLEEERVSLEADRADMEEQSKYLDELLTRKRAESDNYDAQIAKAKQEAAAYKKKIQQEQAQIKKLQEEERRKAAAAAASKATYTVTKFDTSVIDNASGSDLGKKIAKYACQFIGNPYVAGGTSLTKGADCSGFTYRIYSDFGYTLPRTSLQQRSAGKEVTLEQAQPGDLVCYSGHVALYVGGGYVVHASSPKAGIKVSKATYKKILSVRRIL